MVKDKVRSMLGESQLFSLLEGEELELIVEKFELESFELGNIVVNKGDEGDSMYLILTGNARVLGQDSEGKEVSLATLKRGDIFGEQALLKEETRSATIRASSDLMVARLMKKDFLEIVESNKELKGFLDNYMSHAGLNNFLRQFTVFSAMTAKELKNWLKYLETSSHSDGDFIFHENDDPDNFYIVLDGKVEVIKESDEKKPTLAVLEPGSFFGELAL